MTTDTTQTDDAPLEHSEVSPSGATRWMACRGSVKAIRELNLPRDSGGSIYAREGTAAHALGEKCLKDGSSPLDHVGSQSCDFTVTKEMAKAVEIYTDFVREFLDHTAEMWVEVTLKMDFYVKGMKGTPDACLTRLGMTELHMFDYKHGQGVAVEAENNKQMEIYAIAKLVKLSQMGFDLSKIKKVFLHIIQPRCPHPEGPIRTFETDQQHLKEFSGQVREALDEVYSDNPSFCPGESQCNWCPKAPTCKPLAEYSMTLAQQEFGDFVETEKFVRTDPNTLTPQQISVILENSALIKSWLGSVLGHVQNELEHGREIPNYKLVRGRSNRVWASEAEAVKFLKEEAQIPEEDLFKKKFLSPAQAEGLLGKKQAHLIENLWVKPLGSVTIAHKTDKRKPIEPSMSADAEFSEFKK